MKHHTTITIPEGVSFDALKLSRDPVSGDISFDWGPINQICDASGIDPAVFRDAGEGNVCGLIVAWYSVHLARGGSTDPVQEQILAEIQAEDVLGAERVQIASGKIQ